MRNRLNPVEVKLRIPGPWAGAKELLERIPAGFRLTRDSLILPDNTEIGFGAGPPDDQFQGIFSSSVRRQPTPEEMAVVANYKVNIFLMGPGGSLAAAQAMMDAGAAIVRAGGAGVFIDNSALAHGGSDWVAMAEAGEPDALSFAFVSIIRNAQEVWTMGMHVLGLREVVMKVVDANEFDPVDVIRYLAAQEKPMDDGHVIGDLTGPVFRVSTEPSAPDPAGVMFNPFGRFRLIHFRDIAESN